MEVPPKNLIIMGPPGSGKSTQGKMLAEALGLRYLSTGEIFRKIAKEESDLGRRVANLLSKGLLVSDEDTMVVVEKYLPSFGFVVDGFPRNVWQAQNFKGRIDRVIYVAVTDEECLKRILKGEKLGGAGVNRRGRADDTPELIQRRLRLFHKETEPVLDFYRGKGLLFEVCGMGTIDEVFERVKMGLSVNDIYVAEAAKE